MTFENVHIDDNKQYSKDEHVEENANKKLHEIFKFSFPAEMDPENPGHCVKETGPGKFHFDFSGVPTSPPQIFPPLKSSFSIETVSKQIMVLDSDGLKDVTHQYHACPMHLHLPGSQFSESGFDIENAQKEIAASDYNGTENLKFQSNAVMPIDLPFLTSGFGADNEEMEFTTTSFNGPQILQDVMPPNQPNSSLFELGAGAVGKKMGMGNSSEMQEFEIYKNKQEIPPNFPFSLPGTSVGSIGHEGSSGITENEVPHLPNIFVGDPFNTTTDNFKKSKQGAIDDPSSEYFWQARGHKLQPKNWKDLMKKLEDMSYE